MQFFYKLLIVDLIVRIGRSYENGLGRFANDALSQTEADRKINDF